MTEESNPASKGWVGEAQRVKRNQPTLGFGGGGGETEEPGQTPFGPRVQTRWKPRPKKKHFAIKRGAITGTRPKGGGVATKKR